MSTIVEIFVLVIGFLLALSFTPVTIEDSVEVNTTVEIEDHMVGVLWEEVYDFQNTSIEEVNTFNRSSYVCEKEELIIFLENNTIDTREYIRLEDYEGYICIDFAIDLAHALIDDGYDAGVVNIVSTGDEEWHCMNWVMITGETVYIEPQNDSIGNGYHNTTLWTCREIPVEWAERNRNDMRRWRR